MARQRSSDAVDESLHRIDGTSVAEALAPGPKLAIPGEQKRVGVTRGKCPRLELEWQTHGGAARPGCAKPKLSAVVGPAGPPTAILFACKKITLAGIDLLPITVLANLNEISNGSLSVVRGCDMRVWAV